MFCGRGLKCFSPLKLKIHINISCILQKTCFKSIVKLTQAKIVTFLIFSWSYIVLKAFNETNFPFINLLTAEICQETNC